ncbi:MAG: LamG domain-containing protein [Thermoanaerobaculia bacterium]|nr:LamG domain-containing protein [Thermoanaerobaculia bacterium]
MQIVLRLGLFLLLTAVHGIVAGQDLSEYSLRFFGTGVGPPGQQDRILIPVDDNTPGASSSPIDVGAGSFTIEWWVRGLVEDNDTPNAGGDIELFDYSWIDGNIILDRDVWCGTANAFGVSLAGGFVRFGVDSGDFEPSNDTIEGNVVVLDGTWHHVAVVRDAVVGDLTIVVDGSEDFRSTPGISTVDLSYPDDGVPVTGDCGTGQLTPYGWFLVVAAEKHDAGAAYPSFNGFVDELRIWNVARTDAEIAADRFSVLSPSPPGLVGSYRFEEGSGTVLGDSSGSASPDGELRSGTSGDGEWFSRSVDPLNTAPIGEFLFADGFESGGLGGWS